MNHTRVRPGAILTLVSVALAACGNGSSGGPAEEAISLPISSAPQVASDGNGNFMALWQSGVSIVARYYDQGSGGQNFIVSRGERPTLAMSASGESHVLWQAFNPRGYDIYSRTYDSAIDAWSGEDVFFAARDSGNSNIWPAVAAYDDSAMVVWQLWGGRDDSARSNRSAEYVDVLDDNLNGPRWFDMRFMPIFQTPSLINSTLQPPKVAMGANRRAMSAWVDTSTAEEGLHVSRYEPFVAGPVRLLSMPGSWTEHWRFKLGPQIGVVKTTGYDIAVQPNGDAFAIWQQVNQVLANRYYESTDTWEGARPVATVEPTSDSALAIHDLGYALVVAQYNDVVRAHHYVPNQTWATGWQPPIQLNAAGNVEGSPDVAIADDGRGLAVWVQDGNVTVNSYDGVLWTGPVTIGQGRNPQVALENGGSCLVVWEQDGFIIDYNCNLPTPTFSVSPTRPQPGDLVTFDASGSSDDGGTITSYEWDFEDDGSFDATGVTASTTYAAEGTYTVRLRITNDRGFSNSVVANVTVSSGVLLSVNLNGSGGVTSSSPGIDCGSDCGETYAVNDIVTLMAAPALNWSFDRWQGDCAAGAPDRQNPVLTFTIAAPVSGPAFTCTAEFQPTAAVSRLAIDITTDGVGSSAGGPVGGRVTSSPAGIDCAEMGSDCLEDFATGTTVMLEAIANSGYEFVNWQSGVPGCSPPAGAVTQITMDQSIECQADFRTAQAGGPGRDVRVIYESQPGRVVDTNTGQLDCTNDCTVALPEAASPIRLRAVNGTTTWTFWDGCDSQPADPANPSGPPLCEIDITTMPRTVVVVFVL